MRKKGILAVFAVGLMMASQAFAGAPHVSFGGGGKDGQYIQIAKSGCDGLGKIFDCTAEVTGGSGANKDAIIAGNLNLGLAMGGLVKEWEAKDPAFKENVVVVRYIAGEALFAYGKPDVVDALVNWEGVKNNAFLVSFGAPGEGSGDLLTLKNLQSGDGNPLSQATVTPYKTRDEQVAAVLGGQVQLGFAAQFPNPSNDFFKAINDNGLTIMPVIDTDLAIKSDLYGVKSVRVENASVKKFTKGKTIETMYVPVAILARNPAKYTTEREQKIQQAVIDRMKAMPEADLLPKAGWLTDFLNGSAKMSSDALAKLSVEMKEAAKAAKQSALGKQ